jgi:hypothetical protein
MHGMHIKIIQAQQAKIYNIYRNTKLKLLKTNTAIWFNKMCRTKQIRSVCNIIEYFNIYIYRVSQEECARLQEGVPYVKVYRYNPKHLCPKLNSYRDNGQRSLKL